MRLFCCKKSSGTYPPAKIVCRVKHVIHVTGRRTSAKSWSLSVVHSLKRASPAATAPPYASASVHPPAGERPRRCPCRKADKRSIRKEHEAQEGAWVGGKERGKERGKEGPSLLLSHRIHRSAQQPVALGGPPHADQTAAKVKKRLHSIPSVTLVGILQKGTSRLAPPGSDMGSF